MLVPFCTLDARLNTSTRMDVGTAAEADQPQPQPPQDMNDGGITADQRNDVNQVTMDLSASSPLSIAGEPDQLESSSVSRSQELPSQNSLESHGML